MIGVVVKGLGLLFPLSSEMLVFEIGEAVSSTVALRPRERLVFGGSGFTLCLVGLTCVLGTGPSWRLGVITPGFSRWDAISSTLREDDEAGVRCIPSRSIWLCLRGVSSADAERSRSSPGGDDKSSSELSRVLFEPIDWDDSNDVPMSASDRRALSIEGKDKIELSSLCEGRLDSCGSGSSRSQSTAAHRRTSLRVVSSTSSKCMIFSESAAASPVS
jgi:hypothetical protein